jgi:transketolase
MTGTDYAARAREARREIVAMLHRSGGSFCGSALSCIDLLTVLFHGGFARVSREWAKRPDRDIFILSKGHASSALYATLAALGMFDRRELETYGADGSSMQIHPKKDSLPGIDVSTGSLGHGLPLASGAALAAKIQGSAARTFVLMGDGECNEGSVWENAPFPVRQGLGGLTVIVDRNGWQGCGHDREILNYGDLAAKFSAFGFHTISVDGHNHEEIEAALREAVAERPIPTAIVAATVKGKGVSFMENRLEWHYKSPDREQLVIALKELSE